MVHGLSCSVACGILPDQGLNLCLLHWQADSLLLSHLGSPPSGILSCHIHIRTYSLLSSVAQSCLFATPWTAAHQASLSITDSWCLLKLMPIELVMPSNYLILCHPLLLPAIFPSIRVFSTESVLRIRWPKDWSFRFSISPINIQD